VIGYYNASRSIQSKAAFIRTDLSITKQLRVLGGLRVDQFSVPDKAYLAYELASTYKLNDKHLIRFAVTRSNSGSFIGYNYVNVVSPYTGSFIGDTNLKLLTIDMIELGYRVQITNKLQLDVDVFQQKAKNLTAIVTKQFAPSVVAQFTNVPTTATQRGVTLSLNFVPNEKIQFKPFITIQKTETKDKPVINGMPSDYIDPTISPVPVVYTTTTHKYTPSTYGGFYFNYRPITKFNVNLNGYFFGKQSQYDLSWNEQNVDAPQYAHGQVKAKFMLSAKVSYEVYKGINLFINARNLSSEDSREFYAADRTQGLYLAGASFNFND
jgi:iron complex outermembrane receptor protein